MNTSDRRSPSIIVRRLTHLSAPAVLAAGLFAGALPGCSTSNVVTFSESDRKEGIRLIEQERYTDAASHFRQQVRRDPADYKGHYYLGVCYERTGQRQQAIHAYKASLDTMSTTLAGQEDKAFRANIIDALASAIAKYDSSDTELNTIEQFARDQQSAEGYYTLAKIYQYKGDADSAIDSYNRAMLLAPKDFYIARDQGLYLEQMGQKQLAEAPLKRAYTLNSADTNVNAALRRIGIIPGPAIMDEKQLANPPVPKGPIPPVNEWRAQKGQPQGTPAATATPAEAPSIAPTPAPANSGPTVQAPRD